MMRQGYLQPLVVGVIPVPSGDGELVRRVLGWSRRDVVQFL